MSEHITFEGLIGNCKDEKLRMILQFIYNTYGIRSACVDKEDELKVVTRDGNAITIFKGFFCREKVEENKWKLHEVDIAELLDTIVKDGEEIEDNI